MGRLSGALLGWAPGITTSLLPTFVNNGRKKFYDIGGRSYDAIKHKTEKYFAAFVLCEFLNFCVLVSSSENFYSSFRESALTPWQTSSAKANVCEQGQQTTPERSSYSGRFRQGSLTEGEGLVRLASLYYLG